MTVARHRRRVVVLGVALGALLATAAPGCNEDGGGDRSASASSTTTPPGSDSPLDRAGGHDASIEVTYTIQGDGSGPVDGRDQLAELEDRLVDALEASGIGELGADRFEDGTVILTLTGPDLDRLWARAKPILASYPPRPAWAELRDGGPEQPATRVDL